MRAIPSPPMVALHDPRGRRSTKQKPYPSTPPLLPTAPPPPFACPARGLTARRSCGLCGVCAGLRPERRQDSVITNIHPLHTAHTCTCLTSPCQDYPTARLVVTVLPPRRHSCSAPLPDDDIDANHVVMLPSMTQSPRVPSRPGFLAPRPSQQPPNTDTDLACSFGSWRSPAPVRFGHVMRRSLCEHEQEMRHKRRVCG